MLDHGRRERLIQFYSILDILEQKYQARRLGDCTGRMRWPERGVYFFREDGENRSDSGQGPRIVRVGTHAISEGSRTTLWRRLAQHRGQIQSGGGNHRASIFRELIGSALIKRGQIDCPTWLVRRPASPEARLGEFALEQRVSNIVGNMWCLWLPVEDKPGPKSRRGYIERNAIALLSNFRKPNLDRPSLSWLGHDLDSERVKQSGLWNQDHVDGTVDDDFITVMDQLVSDSDKRA